MTSEFAELRALVAKLEGQHDRDRAEIARLDGLLAKERVALARIEEWTHVFGAALKPRGADTYGEGVRDAKARVSLILRNDPHAVVGTERDEARAEVERMRPVYEAAKEPAHFACAPNETPEPSDHPADLAADERAALRDLLVSLELLPINEAARRAIEKVLAKEGDRG